MEGALDDLHEVRDRHDQMLYRLYVKWVSATSTVWVLDGRSKPNNTRIPDADYDQIRQLADLVDSSPPPAASTNDFAQMMLTDD